LEPAWPEEVRTKTVIKNDSKDNNFFETFILKYQFFPRSLIWSGDLP